MKKVLTFAAVAEAATGLALLILGMAVAAPLVGRLLDRLPLRRVLIGGACAMAAGLFAIAFTRSLPLAGAALVLVAMGATALIGRLFGTVV